VENDSGIITITTEYEQTSKNVIASISDNGHGIDPQFLEEIFTPFYSAKGQKGTGLGLAVAKKIFAEHHGTIDVESKIDAGTTFHVTLNAGVELHHDPNDTMAPVEEA